MPAPTTTTRFFAVLLMWGEAARTRAATVPLLM
jgi:hypothetical protein